jgi:hypothetical protein
MKIPYLSILIGGHALIAVWLSMAVFSSDMNDSGYATLPGMNAEAEAIRPLPASLADNPSAAGAELAGNQDFTQ